MPPRADSSPLTAIPSVDEILRSHQVQNLIQRDGPLAVKTAIRSVLGEIRAQVLDGKLDSPAVEKVLDEIPTLIDRELQAFADHSLRPVINATGVILHTNLGRAPLATAALDHLHEVASSYSNLELDLLTGDRGRRDARVDRLFNQLLSSHEGRGASVEVQRANSSTLVVNNNAAAVLLALNSLADGGEVLVSRGELIEIGGSFRIPDVMSKSNATLREVGTTNRTRIEDYEQAINEHTRLVLRVHRSNFEITGFTEQPALAELVALSRTHGIPLMEDLGSGALFDLRSVGIAAEPSVFDSLYAGVDIVSYSGDKLLGGPQAGLITGRSDFIARMRSNPLFRALRVDKLTYSALESTLLSYIRQDLDSIPAVRMMRLSKDSLRLRAEALQRSLSNPNLASELIEGESLIGGGAAPSASLSTWLLAVKHRSLSTSQFAARLRTSDRPIIARIEGDRLLLDFRTVFPEQDLMLLSALQAVP